MIFGSSCCRLSTNDMIWYNMTVLLKLQFYLNQAVLNVVILETVRQIPIKKWFLRVAFFYFTVPHSESQGLRNFIPNLRRTIRTVAHITKSAVHLQQIVTAVTTSINICYVDRSFKSYLHPTEKLLGICLYVMSKPKPFAQVFHAPHNDTIQCIEC